MICLLFSLVFCFLSFVVFPFFRVPSSVALVHPLFIFLFLFFVALFLFSFCFLPLFASSTLKQEKEEREGKKGRQKEGKAK